MTPTPPASGQGTFVAEVTLPCPFCSGTVSADRGNESEGRPGGVVHTLPVCKRFNDLEPDAFLVAVNTEMRTKKGIGYT